VSAWMRHGTIVVVAVGLAGCWQDLAQRGCVARALAVNQGTIQDVLEYAVERERLTQAQKLASMSSRFARPADAALELGEEALQALQASQPWQEWRGDMVEVHDLSAEASRAADEFLGTLVSELLETDVERCPPDFKQQWSALGASVRALGAALSELGSNQLALARAAESGDVSGYGRASSELEQIASRLPLAYDEVVAAWRGVEAATVKARVRLKFEPLPRP